MTQYRRKQPIVTTAEISTPAPKPDSSALERDIKTLRDRVQTQDTELKELRRVVRKLQNELRVAVNTFNLKRNG